MNGINEWYPCCKTHKGFMNKKLLFNQSRDIGNFHYLFSPFSPPLFSPSALWWKIGHLAREWRFSFNIYFRKKRLLSGGQISLKTYFLLKFPTSFVWLMLQKYIVAIHKLHILYLQIEYLSHTVKPWEWSINDSKLIDQRQGNSEYCTDWIPQPHR